ncbi:MAG: hypothetical protein EBU88_20385, partial [Acidobacteria bacterium]|nr:hypothetical protein [Acidobacteriota bacterium]
QTFPSGAYQLLTVTFDVASNASSAASQISFGDQPVAREMVDTTASRLNTTFTSGAVKVVTHVQPPGILINPTPATSDDTIVVDVAGIWNDGCVPSNPDVTRNGSVIVLRTRHQGDYCSQAITTYRMNRTIGTLPPGTYSLVLIHDNMPSIGGSLQFGSSSFSVQARLVNANASSYNSESIAPQSIVVMFGQDLATTTITASAQQPPTSLGGTSVRIRDAVGVERLAPLFFVSATQVNYLVPAETAKGRATITLTNANGRVSVGTAMITSIAPGIFSIDGTGRGLVAGYVQRHTPSGEVRIEPIWRPGNAAELLPQPIDLGPPTDQVYLVIFGTGFRSRSS